MSKKRVNMHLIEIGESNVPDQGTVAVFRVKSTEDARAIAALLYEDRAWTLPAKAKADRGSEEPRTS